MRKGILAVATTGALALTGLAACGNNSGGTSGSSGATKQPYVGVILPDSKTSARWEGADRPYLEQAFKDTKEVWGAGQQQVRNLDANVGCFNLNLWMYSLTEAWAWQQSEEELVDRRDSPWDSEPRRPSHADKRKALQRVALRVQIEEALAGRPTKREIRQLVERLLDRAA